MGRSKLYVDLLLLLVFVLHVCPYSSQVTDDKEASKIKFSPLPKPKSYTLDGWRVSSWGLSGLVDISRGLALAVKPNAPYDIISNVFRAAFGKSHKPVTVSQVLDYETPLIILAALSLVCALLIPIAGLIFCCCRCWGHCGGDFEAKMVRHPIKARCWYTTGLSVCAFFLVLGGAFIFVSSVKMNDSLEETRLVWLNSFDDVITYKNNTFKELSHISKSEVISGLDVIISDVVVLSEEIVMSVINEGAPLVNDLVSSLQQLSQAVTTSLAIMNDVSEMAGSLVSSGSELRAKLSLIKKDLASASDDCTKNSGTSCDDIPSGNITAEADFTKVPNISNTTTSLEKVEKVDLMQEAAKGNDSFYEIPESVGNLTSHFTQKFENYSSNLKDIYLDVLEPLENKADQFIEDNIIPFRDNVDAKYLAPDGLLPKYDKYRHVFYLLLGSLMLIDACLILLGMCLGVLGSNRFDTPVTRSRKADLGGRILLGAAGMFFISIFFINLFAGVLFLLGSNVAVVCEDVSSLELWKHTLDNPKVMGEYPLSKMLFNDGSIDLRLGQILSECQANDAPWTVLRMDNLFNLSSVLNYRSKIPSLDSVFVDLNSTITDTVIVTDSTKKSVNDSAEAGVQHINYTRYHEQVNQPIVDVSLLSLAEKVTSAANTTKSISTTSNLLKRTAENLTTLHQEVVVPSEQNSRKLGDLVKQLEGNGLVIVTSVDEINKDLGVLMSFLSNEAPLLAAQGVIKHGGTLFDTVDTFLNHVTYQVESEVGRCRAVRNIYNGLTGSLCHEYGGGLNASWVGFGICSLALFVSIILCVRAAKLFRRVPGEALDDESVDVKNEEELQLPWMDDLVMGGGNVNLVVKSFDEVRL